MGTDVDYLEDQECGCLLHIWTTDCYNIRHEKRIKTCDTCAKREKLQKEANEVKRQQRVVERNRHKYIRSIYENVPSNRILIKAAIDKYRQDKGSKRTDVWILKHLQEKPLCDILEVQKEKARWFCNKDRLDFVDFKKLEP